MAQLRQTLSSLAHDPSPVKTNVLIYDQTFENCRFCILGCGQDHPVFWGFVECDKHKTNRLRYLQQAHELTKQGLDSQDTSTQDHPMDSKEEQLVFGQKKKTDWLDRVNAKLVKSCKVMDALATECLPCNVGLKTYTSMP